MVRKDDPLFPAPVPVIPEGMGPGAALGLTGKAMACGRHIDMIARYAQDNPPLELGGGIGGLTAPTAKSDTRRSSRRFWRIPSRATKRCAPAAKPAMVH